jgi:anti-sigma factor RsiW
MITCDHSESVGAYVLEALGEPAASEFTAHLHTCEACTREVAELQVVADNLPLAAPQVAPSRALKDRIMSVVESEAQLLRAAGAGADRAPVDSPRSRRWMPRLGLRPAMALGAAACVIVAAVVALGQSGGADSRTFSAALAPAGAQVAVKVTGDRAQLSVKGMPAAAAGKVYEVWLIRQGERPQPTHALFGVREGRAVVEIPDSLKDADAVWVTAEPSTGSVVPTSAPVIKTSLT